MLSINDHNRQVIAMNYVYPVISRRAGGVSVGINLNPNNACNWACLYCQVPNLVRGGPPAIDLALLEHELQHFLNELINGDFMRLNVEKPYRQLVDIAFSGNGEPTSAPEFPAAVDTVERVLTHYGYLQKIKIRLITNGSLVHKATAKAGIAHIGKLNGEIWFKVDSATTAGIEKINQIRLDPHKVKESLIACAELAPTWVQTCLVAIDGKLPDETESTAYLDFLSAVRTKIKGVLLYGMARPSLQSAAARLSALPALQLRQFAERITALGINIKISQ